MAEPAPSLGDVALDEPFTLDRRSSALVDGHRLRFDAVVEDSRCPTNVTCVWEGKAVVSLTFTGEQSIGEIRLEIPGFTNAESEPQESQMAVHQGYAFTLLALDPYPGSDDGVDANATPTATIVVTAE